jgi:hypothetical protein
VIIVDVHTAAIAENNVFIEIASKVFELGDGFVY